jgi:hypothetical protein
MELNKRALISVYGTASFRVVMLYIMGTSRLTNGYGMGRKGADMPASYIRPHHNVAPCQRSAVPKIDRFVEGRLLACREPLMEQCIYNPAPSFDDLCWSLWSSDVTGHCPPSTVTPTLIVSKQQPASRSKGRCLVVMLLYV